MGPPKKSKSKTNTECEGLVNVDYYEWQGTRPNEKMAVLKTKQDDFVGIIDNGS